MNICAYHHCRTIAVKELGHHVLTVVVTLTSARTLIEVYVQVINCVPSHSTDLSPVWLLYHFLILALTLDLSSGARVEHATPVNHLRLPEDFKVAGAMSSCAWWGKQTLPHFGASLIDTL